MELREMLAEAQDRGPAWREAIQRSLMRMRALGMRHMPDALATKG